ncbi:hypothetical protein P5673_012314 [Acropora cervicornis]|uniref:Uncharacterized protein n=1 Tax=Acropora cervicornis TaxID=6130 RepID=A0AAD9V7P8_ACRCE|nr:hypothetical protein P5673_012314 [Acropora cervicornis]
MSPVWKFTTYRNIAEEIKPRLRLVEAGGNPRPPALSDSPAKGAIPPWQTLVDPCITTGTGRCKGMFTGRTTDGMPT